jgi:hypothetical protein
MKIKQLLGVMLLLLGYTVLPTSTWALNPQPLPPGLKSPYSQATGKHFGVTSTSKGNQPMVSTGKHIPEFSYGGGGGAGKVK